MEYIGTKKYIWIDEIPGLTQEQINSLIFEFQYEPPGGNILSSDIIGDSTSINELHEWCRDNPNVNIVFERRS